MNIIEIVIEDIIRDLMFVFDLDRNTAERVVPTMIKNPGMLVELAEKVNARKTR